MGYDRFDTRFTFEQVTQRALIKQLEILSLLAKRLFLGGERETKTHIRLRFTVYFKTHFISKKVDKFTKSCNTSGEVLIGIIYFLSEVTVLLQGNKDRKIVKRAHISQLKLRS